MFTLNFRSDDNVRGYADVTDWRLDKSPISHGWVVHFTIGDKRFMDVLDGEFVVRDANGNIVAEATRANAASLKPIAMSATMLEEPVSGTPESCPCDNVSISAQTAIRIVRRMNLFRKAASVHPHGCFSHAEGREWVQQTAKTLGVEVISSTLDPVE